MIFTLWLVILFPLWIVATHDDECSMKSSPPQPHEKEDLIGKAAPKQYCQTYKRKNRSLLADKQRQYSARIKAEDAIKAQEDVILKRKSTSTSPLVSLHTLEHVPCSQPIQRALLPPKKRYRYKSQD